MRRIKKIGLLAGVPVVLGIVLFSLGPQVDKTTYIPSEKVLPQSLDSLKSWVEKREANNDKIKPDNEAKILFVDSIPRRTKYVLVYLHGWSASQKEGDPVHKNLAKRFGMNLFLTRLAHHGINEEEPLLNLTGTELLTSADEAIEIAKKLGDKLIVVGTSTGGTLGLALQQYHPEIAALVLYSPNIEIYDPNAKLLSMPWGLEMARQVKGSDYHEFEDPKTYELQYWTTKYRLEALTHLQSLVEQTMTTEVFNEIKVPTFLGYFYKNDSIQDKTVSVPAMLEMFESLGTSPDKKVKVAFPDAGAHVISSSFTSASFEKVEEETANFLESVVGITTLQ